MFMQVSSVLVDVRDLRAEEIEEVKQEGESGSCGSCNTSNHAINSDLLCKATTGPIKPTNTVHVGHKRRRDPRDRPAFGRAQQ